MRWDELFADLEAQADALELAERGGEVGERARIEFAAIAVHDRIRAAVGTSVRLQLAGGLGVTGAVARVGADWLLVHETAAGETFVVLDAVRAISGLGRFSATPGTGGAVLARLTLRSALRAVARDRSTVRLHLVDGEMLAGTIDRVGADFVETARHPVGEARRRGEVRDVVLVPFAALAAIRREAP